MGAYLTHTDLRKEFAIPLQQLANEFRELCDKWQQAYESREIVRPDLLLNQATSQTAMNTLRRFLRESSGKLQDAIAGVYRYRDAEIQRQETEGPQGPTLVQTGANADILGPGLNLPTPDQAQPR